MRIGLALPQYDYAADGADGAKRLAWSSVLEAATSAERLGFHSLWLADHLFLSVEKYGGPADPFEGFEPIITLAALARRTTTANLGTLVLCSQLRPAGVLAKQLAAVDLLSNGRLIAGMGAGWYEPEYEAAGIPFRQPGRRLAELTTAIETVRRVWSDDPGTPPCLPPPVQRPGPPIWVGGKGDRLLQLVATHADGWNTVWRWTISEYRERLEALDQACRRIGRDPGSVTRSVGLYTLVGEDERDLQRRFNRLKTHTPPGVLTDETLEDWRRGRLVGTVEEVREQLASWKELGVAELIVGLGAVPFALTTSDDLEMVASAAALGAICPASEPPN